MEKTKTCEFDECEVIFTYEPNPKYPDKRKYCDTHSAIVKASYKSFKAASESKPTHQPIHKETWNNGSADVPETSIEKSIDKAAQLQKEQYGENVPVEHIPYKEQMYEDAPTSSKPKEKEEYEIGKRRVRSYALANAIEYLPIETADSEVIITLAKEFEGYILGEK